MTDKEEIIRALSLWFKPGDVFEIRALGATSSGSRQEHTVSGYFDFEHIRDAAEAVCKLYGCRGVYATANPVRRDLLARAVNRIRPIGRHEPTTSDGDIARRKWLLIDCDADRPAGISSTDAEHEAALAKIREIRDGLASLGWPQPVMTDSGNGAQLMYAIDLPANDCGLVQKCLESLSAASDEHVHVDKTVSNPARIWRIPGTMNCKGDHAEGFRPHRMAHILEATEEIVTVTEDQLRDLIGEVPAEISTETSNETAYLAEGESFDLDAWIAAHCPDLGPAQPYKDGRKWIFPVCPFHSEHTNRSAALFQNAAGAIGFRCLHNSCLGNDWRKLRVMLEPGCYDHKAEAPGVDLSGMLGGKAAPSGNLAGIMMDNDNSSDVQTEIAETFTDPGKIQEKLLHIPGFIDELTEFSMDSAPYPNRVLSFCGALTFLAYLVGRNTTDERNNRANIYLIALANSGVGKDHPRKVNMNLAVSSGLGSGIADAFASGEGLEDALYLNPSMLFQVDEFDTLFNTLKFSNESRSESIIEKMLRIYSSSSSIFKLRKRALSRNELGKRKEQTQSSGNDDFINNPNLVIFGTAIPQMFYESLSTRLLANGLTARCLILNAGKRSSPQKAKVIRPTESILRSIEMFKCYSGAGNLTSENPAPMVIPATAEADARLDELSKAYDELYRKYEKVQAQVPMAFWARALEKVCKLSMLYAVSANPANPVINEEAVSWAQKFVDFLTEQTLFLVHAFSYENPFDEKCQKALRYIREAGGEYNHSQLLKRMHESKDVFDKIMSTLIDNGTVALTYTQVNAKASKSYRLA